MRMRFGGFTLLTEIEVFQDGAFVEVTNNGTDTTSITNITTMNGKTRFFGFLNSLHFGEIIWNVSLVGIEDLGNLKSHLRICVCYGSVNLLLNF
jgi:hypothetical protein